MIIARLAGGLGNQMFQYAAGLRLATLHSVPLKLDLSFLLDRTPVQTHVFRDFDLGIFKLDTAVATDKDRGRFYPPAGAIRRTLLNRVIGRLQHRQIFKQQTVNFDPRVLSLGSETYLEGYFQDERYFTDIEPEIRRRFSLAPDESSLPPATRALAQLIRGQSCICLNVRRGDYVNHPFANNFHGVCTIDYYTRALQELRARGIHDRVMVFSDDQTWSRENFTDPDVFTIVGDEHAGERYATKFWLMTLCRHFIIPNSTFAWWAAWLNQSDGKVVVRPSQWVRAAEYKDQDICPASWIRVPVTF